MIEELRGLNGGRKQFYLRLHRKEIEDFYFKNGPDSTMAEYNLRQQTLQRFLERRGNDYRLTKLSQSDRWVWRMAQEGRELKARVGMLEEWQREVTPVISVGKALINATMATITHKVESAPLPEDQLILNDLLHSRRNEF